MDNQKSKTKLFSPVHLDIPCVLFFKTRHPIDPIDFVHKICEEIVARPGVARMKYVNRLTPMTLMAKATEKGLEDLGKTVLGEHFNMIKKAVEEEDDGQNPTQAKQPHSVNEAHSRVMSRHNLI